MNIDDGSLHSFSNEEMHEAMQKDKSLIPITEDEYKMLKMIPPLGRAEYLKAVRTGDERLQKLLLKRMKFALKKQNHANNRLRKRKGR